MAYESKKLVWKVLPTMPASVPGMLEKLIHPSSVTEAGCSDGSFVALAYALVPLKLSACPTLPVVVVAPPCSVALFGPVLSFAFPSPLNQLMMFAGAAKQLDGPAVSVSAVAVLLSVKVPPLELMNFVVNAPLTEGKVRTWLVVPW